MPQEQGEREQCLLVHQPGAQRSPVAAPQTPQSLPNVPQDQIRACQGGCLKQYYWLQRACPAPSCCLMGCLSFEGFPSGARGKHAHPAPVLWIVFRVGWLPESLPSSAVKHQRGNVSQRHPQTAHSSLLCSCLRCSLAMLRLSCSSSFCCNRLRCPGQLHNCTSGVE